MGYYPVTNWCRISEPSTVSSYPIDNMRRSIWSSKNMHKSDHLTTQHLNFKYKTPRDLFKHPKWRQNIHKNTKQRRAWKDVFGVRMCQGCLGSLWQRNWSHSKDFLRSLDFNRSPSLHTSPGDPGNPGTPDQPPLAHRGGHTPRVPGGPAWAEIWRIWWSSNQTSMRKWTPRTPGVFFVYLQNCGFIFFLGGKWMMIISTVGTK